jgi:hypothetical protein
MMTHSFEKKVLAKLGHVNPSSFFYRQLEGSLQSRLPRRHHALRKLSSFRYLRSRLRTLKTTLVIPTPERTRGAKESAFPDCYRIPSTL